MTAAGFGRAAEDYLKLRRSFGFELDEPGKLVLNLADRLDREGTRFLTAERAVQWATAPGGSAYWHWLRLSAARGFAGYLHAVDARHHILPGDLLPRSYWRVPPFWFSEHDIATLMTAAAARPWRLHAATYQTLIGLLGATGMRPGEAYALDRQHVDLAGSAVTIVKGKYGKTRQLFLHPSTVAALQDYALIRDKLARTTSSPAFFLSMRGTRLHENNAGKAFGHITAAAGIGRRSAKARPVLMSLRHSFAVNTLIGWYRSGIDVDAHLPLLSAWLGHVDPASTYWYLQAVPELMELAARRLRLTEENTP
jgi:integrase/recombinase XerD